MSDSDSDSKTVEELREFLAELRRERKIEDAERRRKAQLREIYDEIEHGHDDGDEVVRLLRKYNLDIDVGVDHLDMSALHVATLYEKTDVVKKLIEHHANLDRGDESGTTPIMSAAARKDDYLLLLLLEAGADPSLKDEKGRTALDYAVKYEKTNIQDVLVRTAMCASSEQGACMYIIYTSIVQKKIIMMIMTLIIFNDHSNRDIQDVLS